MKVLFLVLCASAVVGVVGQGALKCHQGKDAAAAKNSTDCPVTSPVTTKCSGPLFAEYTGYTAQQFGCGECPVNSDATCKDCSVADCNAPVAQTHSFKCINFAFDNKTERFTMKGDLTTCNAEKDTTAICNSPGRKADKDYVSQKLGCGPCVEADKTAEKCKECDGDRCNSAATITAFLLPMISLFYTLF